MHIAPYAEGLNMGLVATIVFWIIKSTSWLWR